MIVLIIPEKIKEVTETFKKRHQKKLVDENGVVIIDQQKIVEGIPGKFYDQIPNECCFENPVIKIMNNGKAAGPDILEAEFLKLLSG